MRPCAQFQKLDAKTQVPGDGSVSVLIVRVRSKGQRSQRSLQQGQGSQSI